MTSRNKLPICSPMASNPRHSDHIDPAAAAAAPPAGWQHDDNSDSAPRIRLMCSFGGQILPRPQDNQLRYVGGDTRMVAIQRNSTYSTLLSKLAKFTSAADIAIKYQLPNEDLDALISITSDEDIENMMEEYDRLLPHSGNSTNNAVRKPRLRMFLFPSDGGDVSGGGFGSVLSGSGASKHENWFLDALNARKLERNRSEASSIVSEVPDYLFGLDNNSDDQPIKWKTNVSISDPGSPAPIVSSPLYGSGSSAQYVPVEINRPVEPEANLNTNSYLNPSLNSVWQYVKEPVPVYYMPGPVQGVGLPLQMPMQYAQPQYRPVYVGGPPPAMGGAYNYVMGPTTAVGPDTNNIQGVIPISRPMAMGVHPGIGGLPARKGSP